MSGKGNIDKLFRFQTFTSALNYDKKTFKIGTRGFYEIKGQKQAKNGL